MTKDVITVVPANEASWEDLQTVFGERGEAHRCQCQFFKIRERDWNSVPEEERGARLREQTNCDDPEAESTSGIVAYLDGEPVGWCAIEPRTAYPRLQRMRVPWSGRSEDPKDDGVWVVSCFTVRTGYRRQGISGELAKAAVEFARKRGAKALEGYPMITTGKEITWGELYVGSRSIFEEAGFKEVSHPYPRRFVMRIDFA